MTMVKKRKFKTSTTSSNENKLSVPKSNQKRFKSFRVLNCRSGESTSRIKNPKNPDKKSELLTENLLLSFNPKIHEMKHCFKDRGLTSESREAKKIREYLKNEEISSKSVKTTNNQNVFFNSSSNTGTNTGTNTGHNTESIHTSFTGDKTSQQQIEKKKPGFPQETPERDESELFISKSLQVKSSGMSRKPSMGYQHSFGNHKFEFEENTEQSHFKMANSNHKKIIKQSPNTEKQKSMKISKSKSQDLLRKNQRNKMNHSNSSNILIAQENKNLLPETPQKRRTIEPKKGGYFELFQKKKKKANRSNRTRTSAPQKPSTINLRESYSPKHTPKSFKKDYNSVRVEDPQSVFERWTEDNQPEDDLMDSDLDPELQSTENLDLLFPSPTSKWSESRRLTRFDTRAINTRNSLEPNTLESKKMDMFGIPSKMSLNGNLNISSKSLSLNKTNRDKKEFSTNSKASKKPKTIGFILPKKEKIKGAIIPKSNRDVKHLEQIDITHKRHRRVHRHEKSKIFW